MAHIIRMAKPGSEWRDNELTAYNITVVAKTVQQFFGVDADQLPVPSVNRVIFENVECPNGPIETNDREFFDYLNEAMSIAPNEESAVDDFAAHLLKLLGYNSPGRLVRQRKHIPFYICGTDSHAKTDVCVYDRIMGILLLMQEDKRFMELAVNPEPQLIAEAIAAFAQNNRALERVGRAVLKKKMIPGITMIGTAPTFFKIHVTQDLVNAVAQARYPVKPTTVERLILPLSAESLGLIQQNGMRPLTNRLAILRCFEAFKQYVTV